jgi:hypothetical protein
VSTTIKIQIIPDAIPEPPERFGVQLWVGTLTGDTVAIGTIYDRMQQAGLRKAGLRKADTVREE